MKRVGIITWHYYPNVGSELQAYALSHYLNMVGYDAEFINYREFHRPKLEWLRATLCEFDNVIPQRLSKALNYHFPHFIRKYLPQGRDLHSANELNDECGKYDTIVCGSDQIWAPSVFNPAYFIDFVKGGKPRKVSYAASIGLPQIPEEKRDIYRQLLSDFDAISVREDEGADLLKELGIDAGVVCDPTLLLTAEEYKGLIPRRMKPGEKTLFCYFLGKNEKHRKMAQEIANRSGLQLVIYSHYPSDKMYGGEHVDQIGPRQFVGHIAHADMVITDSFHGLAFSLIFRKDFYAVERFAGNDAVNQNSRIYNILRHCGLEERLLRVIPSDVEAIDYAKVEPWLDEYINKSKDFISKNI